MTYIHTTLVSWSRRGRKIVPLAYFIHYSRQIKTENSLPEYP
jgi:hypothetical protein